MDIQGTVRDLLQDKCGQIWTAQRNTTVYDAVGQMGKHDIGALIILDEEGNLYGVLSERDYSRKVVLQGRTSRDTLVSEIVDVPVTTVTSKDTINHCMKVMSDKHIRHLPVMDENKLIGIISMGDIVRWVMVSQQSTIEHLQGYIFGQ
ncbi:MAG: CBS domain-containing protein [Luteolibacter sp.]